MQPQNHILPDFLEDMHRESSSTETKTCTIPSSLMIPRENAYTNDVVMVKVLVVGLEALQLVPLSI